jgi:threonyl-tRNA synthetase
MMCWKNIGLVKDDFEIAMRFTQRFYAEHKDFIAEIAAKFGKPMLAECGMSGSSTCLEVGP